MKQNVEKLLHYRRGVLVPPVRRTGKMGKGVTQTVQRYLRRLTKDKMLNLSKKQGRFLLGVINRWEEEEVVLKEMADVLRSSFSIRSFDWKRLARYSFWVAIICGVIAIGAVMADSFLIAWLGRILGRFFLSFHVTACVIFSCLAALLYYVGLHRRRKHPQKIFSNETIIFAGALLTSVAVGFLGKAIDTGSGHFSLLILLVTIIYALLGFLFPSKLLWVFAILSLGS